MIDTSNFMKKYGDRPYPIPMKLQATKKKYIAQD